ncbi:MAG: DNA primase [Clostridia bacterium]|nr:DNA primase [Clostridia bacterium]
MAIPDDVLLEIKYKNDIESIISPYVTLKRAGRNLKGLCPFHNEKTPSFTVYPENGSFYCFGCGAGGDIFTFTRLIENLDYIEAVRLLAERSGVNIPEGDYDNSIFNLKKKIYEINKEAARFYHAYLMSENGKWALDYLLGRGLTIQTIKHFGLGAAPSGWTTLTDYLTKKGYSVFELEQANISSKSSKTGKYFDRFRGRVMFPVIDIRGNVIAFSGRANPAEKDAAKYINSADTPVYKKSRNLFGINFAKNNCAERIILVEGNMDVISLHQAGFDNTVAPLGTAFTEEQAKLLSRYTKEIVVTLDSDTAGQKAVMRALETMKNSGMPIRVLVLPECKDPDEYIKKNGAARFKMLLDGAVSEIEYRLLRAADDIDLNEDNAKIKYLKKAAEILANTDSITSDFYASKLSEKYGVSKSTIVSEISRLRTKNFKTEQKKEIKQVINPKISQKEVNPERRLNVKAAAAEENLISVLMQHPDLYNEIDKLIKPEDMVTTLNREVFAAISELIKNNNMVDISLLGERFTPEQIGYIVSLQNSVNAGINAKKVINDCIAVILKERMLISGTKDENLSIEEWHTKIQNIINSKMGE